VPLCLRRHFGKFSADPADLMPKARQGLLTLTTNLTRTHSPTPLHSSLAIIANDFLIHPFTLSFCNNLGAQQAISPGQQGLLKRACSC
jgi:hypothetical protein